MKYRNYMAVSTVCVVVSIVLFIFVNDFLSQRLSGVFWAAPLISIGATVGFYVAIFKIFIWIYYKFIEDIVNRHDAITGEWCYKLVINGEENNYRVGICSFIKDNMNSIRVSGVHYNPKIKKFTSHFFSEFIEMENSDLRIMYNAIGINSGLDATKGMFFLKTVGNPPETIHGFWADVIPSRNTGSITLERCDDEVKESLQNLGYPTDDVKSKILF